MAIATYSDLQTAVANWTNRTDLTARITEGIALAEAKINRKLRTKDMVTKNAAFAIAAATEYIAVPTGFGGVKSFYLNASPRVVLEFMPEALLTQTYANGTTGEPRNYCIEGANFRFGPQADAAYTATLVYFLQVTALSVGSPTNWLLTSHPDTYLYGSIAEMAALLKDFESAKVYETMLYSTLEEIVSISNQDTWSGAQLFARPG